jgi:hypothetical protein
MKLKDLKTKKISNPIELENVIYNQLDIEFKWKNGDTLPYSDFLYFQDDYEVIIKIEE